MVLLGVCDKIRCRVRQLLCFCGCQEQRDVLENLFGFWIVNSHGKMRSRIRSATATGSEHKSKWKCFIGELVAQNRMVRSLEYPQHLSCEDQVRQGA